MATLCLLPDKVEKFKEDLKNGGINLKDLLSPTMSSEGRTAIFSKYANPEDAKIINTLFEEKIVLKNRMLGITNLFSKLGQFGKYSPEKQAELAQNLSEYKAAQQKRIFTPTEHETFLNDLIDKQVKGHVSLDQARVLDKLSNDIKTAQDSTTAKLSGVSDEYIKSKNAFESYKNSLKPLGTFTSLGKNLAIIGRNHLIMNPATPIKSTVNQIVNSQLEKIGRRLAYGSIRGANPRLARQANAEAWQTFRKTGNNTAAMENMDDTHVLGMGENFRVPTGSTKGANLIEKGVRGYAKLTNKIAIDIEHNLSFTKFYQKTFFDSANIISGSIAKQEGLKGEKLKSRAADIFKDAVRIEPQTKEGKMVRAFSQKQSARITSTNDTWMSRVALAGKDGLNKITPVFPVGDFLVPIAKIPATIIANGVENSGILLPKAVYDIFKGHQKMQSENVDTKLEGAGQYAHGLQRLLLTVGTLAASAWIASQLKKQDFRTDPYGAHYIKIGNTWVNTEYFSAISPALGGMIEAKRERSLGGYFVGVGQSLTALPSSGIDAVSSIAKTGIVKYAGSFITSRSVPAFVSSLKSSRPLEHLFAGAHGVESDQEVKQDTRISAQKAATTRRTNLQSRFNNLGK